MVLKLYGKYLNTMLFQNRLQNKNEPILEPIFRELRFGVALSDIKRILTKDSKILDYGCGPEAKFSSYLKLKNIKFDEYCGFDPLLAKDIIKSKLLITSRWKQISKKRFDLITMFAVLEHVPYPDFDFLPIVDSLKVGGHLLLTTPTKLSKPVLEFLSYKLGIVSRREIEEHQHYFNLEEIDELFSKHNLKIITKHTFEFGMNNYVLFQKK